MLNFFYKMMSKNKKGFTLIELIVVIAILGILAAIAIPRFSGFTERAKEGNDEEYAALVANSVMILASASDLGYTAGADVVITLSPNGNIASITNITYTTKIADIAALRTQIHTMVAMKTLQSKKFFATPGGLQVTTNDGGAKTIAVPAAAVANP